MLMLRISKRFSSRRSRIAGRQLQVQSFQMQPTDRQRGVEQIGGFPVEFTISQRDDQSAVLIAQLLDP